MGLTLRSFCVSLRLTAFVLALASVFTFTAAAAQSTPAMPPARVHEKLVARSIGKGVKITELDGTVVKGILVSVSADEFQVTAGHATQPITILNTQVAKLGNTGLSTAAKIGIGIVIGVVVLIAAVAISLKASGW